MAVSLPLPRGQDAASLQMWGAQLVDQLRRQTQEILATSSNDASDIERLQAAIDEINRQLAELAEILDSLDGETLLSQIAFIRDLRAQVQEVFDSVQAGLDAALEVAQRTALSAIRNGVLGLGNTAQIRVEQQARLEAGYAFAQQIEAMIARIGDAEAAIVTERTVRADGDEAFAQQLESLLARVGQTESAIDTEATVRSTLTTALSELLTTVRAQIGGQEISITSIQQAVDGITAQWGVSINSNGHILGLINLARTSEYTQFTVVADKIAFAQPAATATDTPTPMFAIDSATGKLAFNGDILATGSIRGTAIAAATLDAISANLGVITAGKMRSADSKMVIDLDAKSIVIDF